MRLRDRRGASAGLLALVLLLAVACDSGGGGSGSSIDGSFTSSGIAAAPNLVRLRAGAIVDDMVTVQVALSGPTTSNDIYAFAFDLILSDAGVAQYVNNSATVGGALIPIGGQTTLVQATRDGNRVVVGVSKAGGGAGNAVGASEATVVSLTFQILREDSTTIAITGSPASPGNPTNAPAALDSTGAVIPTVVFDQTVATLTGS